MMRRVAASTMLLAVLGGAFAAWLGLSRLERPLLLPTHGEALLRYAAFLGGAILLAGLSSAALKWRPWACTAGLAVAALFLSGNGTAAAAVAYILLSSALLGTWLLRTLRAEQSASGWTAAVLVGVGLFATVIALTAARTVHYPWVYLLVLALPLVLARDRLKTALAICRREIPASGRPTPAVAVVDAASGGIFLLYVVIALMPEIGHDALAMHLFVPAQLAERHAWAFDAQTYVWAVMPMLADWIFAAAYMLAGETATRLLNVAFLGIVALLVRDLVRWCGGGNWAQRWAVLVLLSMPLTFTLGSSLFIELVWTSFVLAGTLAVLRMGDKDGHAGAAVQAGLFLGFAVAAKAVTLTILPVLLVMLVCRRGAWWSRTGAWKVAQGSALLALFGSFPYINAWLRTGNPVFPFFNGWFRSPLYPAENFDSASVFSKGLQWNFPYEVVFNAGRFIEGMTGAGGFQWLLVLAPSVLALAWARQRRALLLLSLALGSMAIAFLSVAYLRYVFPAFVMTCVVAGMALENGAGRVGRIALGAGAVAAVVLNLLFLGAASPYRDFALAAATGKTEREEWLEMRMPMRRAVSLVNEVNKGNAPVAVLGAPALGHLAADGLMPNWYNFRFERLLLAQESGPDVAKALQDLGVEYLLVDAGWPRQRERELVESVTDPIAAYGVVSVRRWKSEYRFQQELLADPTFETGKGWQFSEDGPRAPGSAIVTVQSPASQAVKVQPARRYLNSITVVCAQPTLARAQVNWTSAAGTFLKTDIRVVECGTQSSSHQMEVVAPPGAATATVYASAHTAARVEFKENSFRR